MGKHRQINKALRDATDPRVLVAADAAMQRGDRQALEAALGINERSKTTWTVHGLDVWGNAEDGFEINNVYPACGVIRLRSGIDDASIVQMLKDIGALADHVDDITGVEIDFNENVADVDDPDTGEPILQLHRRNARHR